MQRAVKNHPTVQQAAAGILRAEAILQQVRSRSLPIGRCDVQQQRHRSRHAVFRDASINPRTQTVTTAGIERAAADAGALGGAQPGGGQRARVACARPTTRGGPWRSRPAEAYLAIITQRRVLELNERARDNAKAHYEYANQRYEGGIGSRLNALRAQQEVVGRRGARRRCAPGDPPRAGSAGGADRGRRAGGCGRGAGLRGATACRARRAAGLRPPGRAGRSSRGKSAAERRASDAWKDYLPSVTALFAPTDAGADRALRQRAVVARGRAVHRAGVRGRADAAARRASGRRSSTSCAPSASTPNGRPSSEIRTAREAVAATERALAVRAGPRRSRPTKWCRSPTSRSAKGRRRISK